jgi:hypothetical protein
MKSSQNSSDHNIDTMPGIEYMYKTQFCPKIFRINYCPQILSEFYLKTTDKVVRVLGTLILDFKML